MCVFYKESLIIIVCKLIETKPRCLSIDIFGGKWQCFKQLGHILGLWAMRTGYIKFFSFQNESFYKKARKNACLWAHKSDSVQTLYCLLANVITFVNSKFNGELTLARLISKCRDSLSSTSARARSAPSNVAMSTMYS